MEKYKLITCIVEQGKADGIIKEILKMGISGVTSFRGVGTGVREKIGLKGRLIEPEKDVFMTVVPEEKTDDMFGRIIELANLKETARGFVFVQDVEKAFGFYKRD
ncbi:MAG: P-II family nitrogen regulator [bacterium]